MAQPRETAGRVCFWDCAFGGLGLQGWDWGHGAGQGCAFAELAWHHNPGVMLLWYDFGPITLGSQVHGP